MNCPWAFIQEDLFISASIKQEWCPGEAVLTGQRHNGAVKRIVGVWITYLYSWLAKHIM